MNARASVTREPEKRLDTAKATKVQEISETRDAALRLFPVETLCHLSVEDIQSAQLLLSHGETFGVWVTPRDWVPAGVADAALVCDLRRRIVSFLPKARQKLPLGESLVQLLDSAVLLLTQYLALLRMGPSGIGKGTFKPLGPSHVRVIAYSFGPSLMALGVAKRLDTLEFSAPHLGAPDETNASVGLLSTLRLADLEAVTLKSRENVLKECRRMQVLGGLGLWLDVPPLTGLSIAEAMAGQRPHTTIPSARDPHLPLPDEYLAQMGSRGLWLMRDLAPNLMLIGEALKDLWDRTTRTKFAAITIRDMRRVAVKELLARHLWCDREGRPIGTPPFALQLPKQKGFGVRSKEPNEATELRWPPQTYVDYLGLLGAVQTAHLTIGLLSMGARQSEILSLKRECTSYAADGRLYANGRTYKLVERHDGEWRDWLLPDAAAEAFEQQLRLVRLGEFIGSLTPKKTKSLGKQVTTSDTAKHLWAQISSSQGSSDCTKQLRGINKALTRYAQTIGMDVSPGGQRLRSHRFRKTLARLVALALTQAPKLLMDVFGHKSIEMTLYYILTDRELRVEIEAVSRELRVMRARVVVETMVEADLAATDTGSAHLGGFGGLSAVAIRGAIEVHQKHIHRQGADWGAASAIELAELLTLQGTAWEQVRPGVLCTKLPGEAGPCNKSKGRPEPSKCQSSCGHRLEEAFLREDVDGSIRDATAAYEIAITDDESLTAAHWAAQVRAHVPRFSDLQARWMLNPTVRALMDNVNSAVAA